MKAVVLKGFGGVENLENKEIPFPEISDTEVMIKVKSIGINPVDIKTRKGKGMADALGKTNPMILGWDISGTVTDTGKNVTSLRRGDEVFGMVNFPGSGKAYAEYVAAPEKHLALKPANISHDAAAAASLAALTAWQLLKEKSRIKPGDRVLIHSAAGGVGHYAVQMAKYLGAEVTGTSSGKNKEFVMELGASHHIDYEKQPFDAVLHDIDFVLDTIGGEYIDRSLKVLKPGGTIISIPSGAAESVAERARAKGMIGYHFRVKSDGGDMEEIAKMLDEGIVKSYIYKTYSFEEMQAAHLQIETGKTRGKVVVTV
jgi:NADPH:quinone reductase-like Zn-dependent oxidoreductase